MELEAFKASLQEAKPPAGLSLALQALWYDGQDDWDRAHDLAQEQDDAEGAWVHAYLHRKEGDSWNANYWYRRAGRSMPNQSLHEEWEAIAENLLAQT